LRDYLSYSEADFEVFHCTDGGEIWHAGGPPLLQAKFCENRARDTPLWGVYIPHFDQISVKISVLGSYALRCTNGVKFSMKEETEWLVKEKLRERLWLEDPDDAIHCVIPYGM